MGLVYTFLQTRPVTLHRLCTKFFAKQLSRLAKNLTDEKDAPARSAPAGGCVLPMKTFLHFATERASLSRLKPYGARGIFADGRILPCTKFLECNHLCTTF
jgi:hypothetical protein